VLAQSGHPYATRFRYYDDRNTITSMNQCVILDNDGYLAVVDSQDDRDNCLNLSLQNPPEKPIGQLNGNQMIVGLPDKQFVLCIINSGKVHPAIQKLLTDQSNNHKLTNLKPDPATYYIQWKDNRSGELCPDKSVPQRVELRVRNTTNGNKKQLKSNSEVCTTSVRKRLCTTTDRQKPIKMVRFDDSEAVVLYANLDGLDDPEQPQRYSQLYYVNVENPNNALEENPGKVVDINTSVKCQLTCQDRLRAA
jgi:hypothetical protein